MLKKWPKERKTKNMERVRESRNITKLRNQDRHKLYDSVPS